MTWGRWYWPVWMAVLFFSFLGPEISALIVNHNNTLSDWVWVQLKVDPTQKQQQWTAAHLLVFGVWCLVVYWLTFHFFYRRYV